MARLADGDRTASREVFALLWPKLERFTRKVLGDAPDTEDAAQLALEKVFARASDYDPSRPALTWALAIAAWECKTTASRARRAAGRASAADVGDLPAMAPNPEEVLIGQRVHDALRDALESLPLADQETLSRAFLEDHEGPKDDTFRKRKERALTRLRAAMRRLYGR